MFRCSFLRRAGFSLQRMKWDFIIVVVAAVIAIIVFSQCIQSMNNFRLMKKASFLHFLLVLNAHGESCWVRANVYGLLFIFNNCNDAFFLSLSFVFGNAYVGIRCTCISDEAEYFQFWEIDFVVCPFLCRGNEKKIGTSALSRILFHRCQIMV